MSNINEHITQMSPLKLTMAAKQIAPKLDILRAEPIAVIGLGCRFPGPANTPDQFWQLLQNGVDAIGEVPADRWNLSEFYDNNPDSPGKMYARHGGFCAEPEMFDPQFFGISPREAVSLDPQQRFILEVAWEALENANVAPEKLFGSEAGVFVGASGFDNALSLIGAGDMRKIDAYFGTGNVLSVAAGRLSYILGLTGPSMVVDTACSSSLVAAHLATQSLRNRECNLALVAGVNLLLIPQMSINFSKARMLSPDGRCKTFSAAANGYVRSEGCGVLVLKRLADALTDGDQILALIRGSAVNQDGNSGGLTVPSGPSQEQVIRQALANSAVLPEQVSYIEAHGTGTSLGDPIEAAALGTIYSRTHSKEAPLLIGSVKTNIGHLEGAAGMASMLKVILSFQHQTIPPHLHFSEPNPHINWDELPFQVPTAASPWPNKQQQIAGISGFGFSGTNAHVIMEAAPRLPQKKAEKNNLPAYLVTLSGKSDRALENLAQRYESFLDQDSTTQLPDISYTGQVGRNHFRQRLAVVAESREALSEKLAA
ncbi:MAG: polyketide synthase, partial [Ardenticatenaceae bacterium]|nr:polyketide synthase [Ardenticatenaceae bacterium]